MLFYEKITMRKLILVLIMLSIFLSIILATMDYISVLTMDDNLFQMLFYISILLWFLWQFIKHKDKVIDLTGTYTKVVNWKEIALIIFFHIIITLGSIYIILLLVTYIEPTAINNVLSEEGGNIPQTITSKIYYAITAVILAPIVEELIFRGVILNRIMIKWGIGKAIVISSVIFGFAHYKMAVIGALTFGICMALLYIKTKNILISMTAHFINNLLVCIVMFIPTGTSTSEGVMTLEEARILGMVIGIPFMFASIVFLYKYIKKNWPKADNRFFNRGTALVIIDVQEALFSIPGNILYKEESFLNNLKLIIEKARVLKIPVIYIQHGIKSTGLLEVGSEGWNIHHDILPLKQDIIVYKSTPDSFKNTKLKDELDSHNIGNLIITGLQTEYCVDTTCRKAWSLGYNVTLIKDAHSTYDTSYLSAEQIIMHHNRILGDWFVTTKTTEEFIDSSLL